MEEEASAISGLQRPNNGFQIVFGRFDFKYSLHWLIIEWYAINIKVPDPEEAETYPSSKKLSTNKLIPFLAEGLNKGYGNNLDCYNQRPFGNGLLMDTM